MRNTAWQLFTLSLLLLGFASALDTYSISRVAVNGGYEISLSINSLSQWQGSISLSSGIYSAVGGQVQWYDNPPEVAVSTLSTNLQNLVSSLNYTGARLVVLKMNPSSTLFALADYAYLPYVRFFGESATTQTPFFCSAASATPLAASSAPSIQSSNSIYCIQSVDVAGTFTANISGSTDFSQRLVFDNSSVAVADVLTPLWTIGFSRLTDAVLANTQIRNIADSNSDRRTTNQHYVGAIYFLFVFAMLHVLIIIVALQTWVLSLRKFLKAFSPIVWFGIYVVVLIAFSFPLGIFAWMLVGAIYVFLALIYLIAYCVIRRRTAHQGDTPVQDITIPGPGNKYELAVDVPVESPSSRSSKCSLTLSERPAAFGSGQKWALGVATSLLLLSLFIGLLLFFVIWSSPDYQLLDRTTAIATTEYIPSELAKGIAVIYGYDRVAYTINVNPFFAWATTVCGDTYKKTLSDSDKKSAIYTDFIEKYSIDMSLYSPSDYTQYASVNDWFIRHLAPGVRPIALLSNPKIMVSPADCRTVVFSRVPPDQRIWLKGNSFNIDSLLYRTDIIDNSVFYQGSLMINRLAPQDYHRFHSPVSGQITHRWAVKGSLLSVGADAITSDNDAIYNQRVVTIIQSPEFGQVAFVGIGASCVGSVVYTRAIGDNVTKGDELGYFEFGGSTVAVLFEPNKVVFDDDVLAVSKNAVEVYVHMGTRLGQAAL